MYNPQVYNYATGVTHSSEMQISEYVKDTNRSSVYHDTVIKYTDLAKYISTEHFFPLVYLYCYEDKHGN